MAMTPEQHGAYNSIMAGRPHMDVWALLAEDTTRMPAELCNHLGLHEHATFADGWALLLGRRDGTHAVY